MLKDNNDAVAGIVVAIMIVGLVIAVMSIIQTVYVPKWMEERESEHMDKVADQFSQLKFTFDALSVTEQDIPITTSIALGSKELGFLMSSKAFGSIAILEDQSKITLDDRGGGGNSTQLSNLKYSSDNAYYLDQSYIYEAGAVILSQARGNVLSAPPSFSVDVNEGNQVDISFHVVKIESIGEKTEIGGYGTYPIRAEYINSSKKVVSDLSNLSIIDTNYPKVWRSFFNTTLSKAGLDYGSDYIIGASDKEVKIEFVNQALSVTIDFKTTVIGVQIGPGWVE